ncbi:MAG: hypothetical protein ACJ76H_06220 [Bacteriovoracaceae bacterium]
MKALSALILVTLLTGTGCSTKKAKDPGKASPPKTPKIVGSEEHPSGTSFDARQLANEMESNFVTEVRFKKGSAALSPEAKKSLAATFKSAKKQHSIDVVKLITWADSEMPSDKKEKLSDDEVELAQRRMDNLAAFIQYQDRKIDVDRISMAERPGGLNKVIPTETDRIQKSLDEAGIPETGEKKKGLGKASRSIIIFTKKE